MKRTTILNLFVLGFVLLFGVTACKKKPIPVTHIPPGANTGTRAERPGTNPYGMDSGRLPGESSPGGEGPIAIANPTDIEGGKQDRQKFAANTVYFDLDSATVKSSEQSNLETVASSFKSSPTGALLIEGHCDERGTEGYNLTLGDRRANALREYLVNLGVSAERIHTVSFGEANPAVVGSDESAYSKNRRGEFIFIEPAQ